MSVELLAILQILLQAAVVLAAGGLLWLAVRKDRQTRLRQVVVRVEHRPQPRVRLLSAKMLAQTGPAISRRHTGPPPGLFCVLPIPPDDPRPGQM